MTVKKGKSKPKPKVKAKPAKSRRPATDAQIIDALTASDGIISDAAEMLGYTRPALSARINKSLELKLAVEEASENIVDLAVHGLREAVKKGDVTACIYITKTLGKKRGFSERHEIDLRERLTSTDVDLSKMSNEELDELIRIGEGAGGESTGRKGKAGKGGA